MNGRSLSEEVQVIGVNRHHVSSLCRHLFYKPRFPEGKSAGLPRGMVLFFLSSLVLIWVFSTCRWMQFSTGTPFLTMLCFTFTFFKYIDFEQSTPFHCHSLIMIANTSNTRNTSVEYFLPWLNAPFQFIFQILLVDIYLLESTFIICDIHFLLLENLSTSFLLFTIRHK